MNQDFIEDGFNQTILFSKNTNLPFTIYCIIAKKDSIKRIPRLKITVNKINHYISIPEMKLLNKSKSNLTFYVKIKNSYIQKLHNWIKLNKQTLLDHWSGKTDSGDFVDAIKKL